MIVTINRAGFLDAAKRAASIAPSESPLDVLKGALMEADAASGKLTITSTNMEVSLEEKLPCSVQEEGSLVFSARMLTEMLQRLPLDTVQISRPDNHGRMALRSENACYKVDVWDRGSFPKPDLPFPEDTVKLSGIPAMAQRTVFATAQDNNKPLLKCVNLKFTNVGLRAAGSNGNCIVTAKGDDQSKGDISLLIPATSLGKLARMCADKDEFRVGTTGKNIVFFKENFLFSARLMEGGYIDTDLLLSTIKNSFTVLTDIQDLRNALSSVLTVEPEGRVSATAVQERTSAQQTAIHTLAEQPGPAGTALIRFGQAPDTEPRPGRNTLRAGTAPSAQAGQHEPVRQERRPAGGSNAPIPRGTASIPRPGPAGNMGNSHASETTRLTAKAHAPTPRVDLASGPVTPLSAKSGKGVPKREKGTVPSRKKRGERT